MDDQLKTVGMVSALFGIMSGDDREGKERRLEGVQKIALNKEEDK